MNEQFFSPLNKYLNYILNNKSFKKLLAFDGPTIDKVCRDKTLNKTF
jgi:hypothetical protein